MGLRLTISLDRDIRELDQFFDDLKFKAVVKSARQGLNEAATGTRSDAIKILRRRRNAKLQDFKGSKKKGKKGFVTLSKARGNDLAKLEARVNFSGVPLPLILFIIGQKTPRRQTQPNSRRKSRRFEVIKGAKKSKPGLFITKAKHGSRRFQVFRRKDKKDRSKGLVMQSASSVAEILRSKMNLLRKIENGAIARMQKSYDRALVNNLRNLRL